MPSRCDSASRRSRSATSGASRSRSVSSSTRWGSATARPRSRPSAKSTLERADPRVRRAQEGVQLAPAAARPGELQQREQRMSERRRREPRPRLDRERDLEHGEHGLERLAPALDRRNDHGDLLGGRAGPKLGEDVIADELDRPAQAGTCEEADRAGDRLRRRFPGLEERALELGERGSGELRGTGRQLLDSSRSERGKVLRGTRERGERGAAGLVGQRDAGRRSGRRAPRGATTRPRSGPRTRRRRRALRARRRGRLRAARRRCAGAGRGPRAGPGRARPGTPRRARRARRRGRTGRAALLRGPRARRAGRR